jgi:hypothetical protein
MVMRMGLERIGYGEFTRRRLVVESGDHISLVGPTRCGKTTTGLKFLPEMRAQLPDTRAVVLVMKPHRKGGPMSRTTGDATVSRLTREYGAKVIRSWPPPPSMGVRKEPPFWVLWPKHSFNLKEDKHAHQEIFGRCLNDVYAKGDHWVFCDEAYSLCEELDLDEEMVRIWTKGGGMGTGLVAATQKPSHVPLWMFSQAAHAVLYRDPDKRARQRYGEISGFDGQAIAEELMALRRHESLYLNQHQQSGCILVPDSHS